MERGRHLIDTIKKWPLQRFLALTLVLCLALTSVNMSGLISFADSPVTFVLSDHGNVTGELLDGVLTIQGSGKTSDYSLENPSPLAEYADEIQSVVIEEGITHLGNYLFYDCGMLSGKLVLPDRLVSIGDFAFSGTCAESAPKFRFVENLFSQAEVAIREESNQGGGKHPSGNADASGDMDVSGDTDVSGDMDASGDTDASGNGDASGDASGDEITGDSHETTEPGRDSAGDSGENSSQGVEEGSDADMGKTPGEGSSSQTPAQNAQDENQGKPNGDKPQDGGSAASTAPSGDSAETSKNNDGSDHTSAKRARKRAAAAVKDDTGAGNSEDGKDSAATGDGPAEGAGDSGETEPSPENGTTAEPGTDETGSEPGSELGSEPGGEPGSEPPQDGGTAEPGNESADSDPEDSGQAGEGQDGDHQQDGDHAGNSGAPQEEKPEPEISADIRIETLVEQEIGQDIFFAGQIGGFDCSRRNETFAQAAQDAGYSQVTSRISIVLEDGSGVSTSYLAAFTEWGIVLPDFSDTNLDIPADAETRYRFLGWKEKTADQEEIALQEGNAPGEGSEPGEEATLLGAYSFYDGGSRTFTAVFETETRVLSQQRIATRTADGLLVEITGNLPAGARVYAEPVEADAAVRMADQYVSDVNAVVAALDITILVDGVKFQPSDYGEDVTVRIVNLNAGREEERGLAVLHVDEDAVEFLAPQAVEKDAVTFAAQRFSVYIVALADVHTVTFLGDGYTLTDGAGNAVVDGDAAIEGVQVSVTTGTPLDFTVNPAEGRIVTSVNVSGAAGARSATLMGPGAGGVYSLINIAADQIVNVTAISPDRTVTYHVNGGQSSVQTSVAGATADGRCTIAYPADVGFTPQAGFRFVGWNTAADGTGVGYPAGTAITLAENQHMALYAIWENTSSRFTAKLYDDSSLQEASGTELTEGGAVANPWNCNSPVRYLVVTADASINQGGQGGQGSQLTVELPAGMQLYDESYTGVGGAVTTVTFQALSNRSGTGGQGTGPFSNPMTGTLTYTFSAEAGAGTRVRIPITFDQKLWDKEAMNGNLTGDFPPVTVTFTAGGVSETKTISKVEAAVADRGGISISAGENPARVKIGGETAMYYTGINNLDRFQSITVEYILPHGNDGNCAVYRGEFANPPQTPATAGSPTTAASPATAGSPAIDASDPSKVTYTWTDCDFSQNTLCLAPVLEFPADKFVDNQTLEYTVAFTGKTYLGTTVRKWATMKVVADAGTPKMAIKAADSAVCPTAGVADAVSDLGAIGFGNEGLGDSDRLQVKYQFDTVNTNVLAIFLPGVPGSVVNTQCILVNDRGETLAQTVTNQPVAAGNSGTTALLARNVAAANGKTDVDDWQFAEITYELDRVPASTWLYNVDAPRTYGSPGAFYGRKIGQAQAQTTLTISSYDAAAGSWSPLVSHTCNTNESQRRTVTTYIGKLSVGEGAEGASATITAGSTVTLRASLAMHPYPFQTSQYAMHPELCFIAPKGVSIAGKSLSASWSDGSGTIATTLREKALDHGRTLYWIGFEGESGAFGGPRLTETGLVSADKTRVPEVSFQLVTAGDMDGVTMSMVQHLFAVERGGNIQIGYGTLNDTADVNDLNEDGQTTDRVGTYTRGSDMKLVIAANSNQLTFDAQAKLSGQPDSSWVSGQDAPLYLPAAGGGLNYRLTLKNDSGGIVSRRDFYYYIPIPKKGAVLGDHMTNAAKDQPEFSLNLTGPVSCSGRNPQMYDIRYSLDATNTVGDRYYDNGAADFDAGVNAGQYATYYTADEIAATNSWDQVTMCKLVASEDFVPAGTEDQFTFDLTYSGQADVGAQHAGEAVAWASCGYQKYTATGADTGVHTPTAVVRAVLRWEQETNVTLHAAVQSGRDNVVSAVIPQQTAFSTAKNLKILEVTPDNVTLVSKATVLADHSTAPNSVADENFALTLQLNGGAEVDLADGTGQGLGVLPANQTSDLTLQLSFYDNLSDDLTQRGATVVVGDGEGVAIIIHVQIQRTPTLVTNPQTVVDAGKRYGLIRGTAQTTITQDSAITAQYVYNITPANCSGQSLQLTDGHTNGSVSFPAGATIALMDLSSPESPGYYYYNVKTAVSQIPLGSFLRMGSATESFVEPASGNSPESVKKTLVFVVDFAGGGLATGSYTLNLVTESSGGFNAETQAVGLEITPARTFSLASSSSGSMKTKLTVTGSVEMSQVLGTDTANGNKTMALEVSLLSGTGTELPLPRGAVISLGAKSYTPTGNLFILPLGDLVAGGFSYTFETMHTRLDAGDYRLRSRLFLAETQGGKLPRGGRVVGEAVTSFSAEPDTQYALSAKVIGQENPRLLTPEEAEQIQVELTTNDAGRTAAITLEMQMKVGSVYITQTNLLTSARTDAAAWSPSGAGVLVNERRAANVTQPVLTLQKGALLRGKTYRLLFKIYGADGQVIPVPYNIIIV